MKLIIGSAVLLFFATWGFGDSSVKSPSSSSVFSTGPAPLNQFCPISNKLVRHRTTFDCKGVVRPQPPIVKEIINNKTIGFCCKKCITTFTRLSTPRKDLLLVRAQTQERTMGQTSELVKKLRALTDERLLLEEKLQASTKITRAQKEQDILNAKIEEQAKLLESLRKQIANANTVKPEGIPANPFK